MISKLLGNKKGVDKDKEELDKSREYIRQLKMRIDGLEADNKRMAKLMAESATTTQSMIDQQRRWIDFHVEIVRWAEHLPQPIKSQFGDIWDNTITNFPKGFTRKDYTHGY